MAGRTERRIKCVLPVKIAGTDAAGNQFERLTCTLDISDRGARLTGISERVEPGTELQVTYKNRRATFRVAWIGRRGTRTEDQIGVISQAKHYDFWPELHKRGARAFVDEASEGEKEAQKRVTQAVASTAAMASHNIHKTQEVNERLKAATEEMFELASLIEQGEVDAAALHEFRHALGYVRNTSWMLQQWMEMQESGGERLPLMTLLNAERLRLAASLCSDVIGFLATAHVRLDLGLVEHFLGVTRQLVVVLRSIDHRVEGEDAATAAASD